MERETTQIKGYHGDAAFEPQVSIEEIEDFEKADHEAKGPAARLRVRSTFAKLVLERTAKLTPDMLQPTGALNAKALNRAALDIYWWPFRIEEDDAAPLG